jgi:hypothetical protein
MGEMASKNESNPPPREGKIFRGPVDRVSSIKEPNAEIRAGEVRGPLARMVRPSEGKWVTSSRTIRIRGWFPRMEVTEEEKARRSTAKLEPAGKECSSASLRMREPSLLISSFSNPLAESRALDFKELLQTSSARRPVR